MLFRLFLREAVKASIKIHSLREEFRRKGFYVKVLWQLKNEHVQSLQKVQLPDFNSFQIKNFSSATVTAKNYHWMRVFWFSKRFKLSYSLHISFYSSGTNLIMAYIRLKKLNWNDVESKGFIFNRISFRILFCTFCYWN